jgi:hypothetical protein
MNSEKHGDFPAENASGRDQAKGKFVPFEIS